MPRTKREVPIERYTVMTLKEVAEKLGVTPMAVCYVEQRALRKIRERLIANGVVTSSGRWST